MERFITILFLFVIFSGATNAQQITVGTYNLRYENPGDIGNLWKDRSPVIISLIRFYDFDILGTQEGLINQLNDISTALSAYSRYGVGRDDGIDAGEHSAIFYKKDRFVLLNKGDFWLSQTPERPSLGWDATCCKRICSWIQLKDKRSGKILWVFNAHYDHQGEVARVESSKLILKKISEIAGNNNVMLTGDLNGGHSTDCYKSIASSKLLSDTYDHAQYPFTNNPSFNGFGNQVSGNEIIDHIFTTGNFKVKRWGILSDTYHGKYPSDHFPVLVELEY